MRLLDLARRVEPVQERHRQIQYDDVWLEFVDRRQQRAAVRHLRHDVTFRREEFLERLDEHRVIVGDDDARFAHAGTLHSSGLSPVWRIWQEYGPIPRKTTSAILISPAPAAGTTNSCPGRVGAPI